MGRIGRGMELAKASWTIVRRDRALMLLPLASGVLVLATAFLTFGPAFFLSDAEDSQLPLLPAAVIAVYGCTFISVYFRVAFAAVVSARLDGQPMPIGDGLTLAADRLGPIAWWTFVAGTVGLLLRGLRQLPLAGEAVEAIVASVLGAVWGALTFFVVPILAIERVGPREAVERSVQTVRRRWGEGVTGFLAITGVYVIALFALVALIGIGALMLDASPAAGGAVIGVALIALVVLMLVIATLQQVFGIVLYRFATDRGVAPGFTQDQLDDAVRRRRRGLLGRLLSR
jgi:hypothetical protein